MEQHQEISGWMRWLTTSEGGRTGPYPGGRYAATAFSESGTLTADLRSIVFDDVPPGPGTGPGHGAVHARWLRPADGPEPGTNLIITEGPRQVAILQVESVAPFIERLWWFRISDSFNVTGRGAAVAGALTGTISHGQQPAELHTREYTALPVTISLQFARVTSDEQPMLLVHDTDNHRLPAGALLQPRAEPPDL